MVKKQTHLSSLYFNIPHKCQVIALLFRVSDYLLIEKDVVSVSCFGSFTKVDAECDDSTYLHAVVPTMGTPSKEKAVR